jgi:hypothetical protein
MAVDSIWPRANRAQAEIQRLHDHGLLGAERSRVAKQGKRIPVSFDLSQEVIEVAERKR